MRRRLSSLWLGLFLVGLIVAVAARAPVPGAICGILAASLAASLIHSLDQQRGFASPAWLRFLETVRQYLANEGDEGATPGDGPRVKSVGS